MRTKRDVKPKIDVPIARLDRFVHQLMVRAAGCHALIDIECGIQRGLIRLVSDIPNHIKRGGNPVQRSGRLANNTQARRLILREAFTTGDGNKTRNRLGCGFVPALRFGCDIGRYWRAQNPAKDHPSQADV